MSNAAADVVEEYFKSKNFAPERRGEEGEAMLFTAGGENNNYHSMIVFSKDSTSCELQILDIVQKVPDDHRVKVIEALNRLNSSYRWVKFYLSDDGSITASDDAVIDLDTCGEEVDRCLMQLVGIVDEAYPEIMKAVYA